MKSKIVSSKNLFEPKQNPTMKFGAKWIEENLPATDEIKCNLCPQTFKKNDPDLKIRKERHELGRHTKHTVISERDGSKSKPMGNFIYGKAKWIQG